MQANGARSAHALRVKSLVWRRRPRHPWRRTLYILDYEANSFISAGRILGEVSPRQVDSACRTCSCLLVFRCTQ